MFREGRADQKANAAGEREENMGVSTKQEMSKSSATAPLDLRNREIVADSVNWRVW